LASLFAGVDHTQPVPVIEGFCTRLATQLKVFPQATYLTELYADLQEHPRYRQVLRRWVMLAR
jgi:hypothetical protein